jgi:hypothetical protein
MRVGLTIFVVLALVVVALVVFAGVKTIDEGKKIEDDAEITVLLAYNADLLEDHENILRAYESVLEEEGVPFLRFSLEELFNTDPEVLVKTKPVVIFADGVNQVIPIDIRFWLYPYIAAGGNVAIIFDAGAKNGKGYYRDRSPFSDILGISHVTYRDLKADSYTYGYLQFQDEDKREYMEIPFGKVGPEGYLSGYSYPQLRYPVARIKVLAPLTSDEVYGYTVMSEDEKYPAVIIRNHGNGSAMYVNLPLGYLKANSDDLPLRSVLRVFLFKEIGIPHLVNVPFNKPGIVLNWHIDDNTEWLTMPRMIEDGLMKSIFEYSMHVTAGDFVESPGDELGFDACGKGRATIEKLKPFGMLGSHGGWAHNWFAENIQIGVFTEPQIKSNIEKNNECMEELTGHKVTEYSSPNGVFLQPEFNKMMEDMNIVAYYSTADSGSAPNRTFVDGEMATDKSISFPIMPYNEAASLYEITYVFNHTPDEIKRWYLDTFEYAVQNRTVRLMYTHPYDLYLYLDEGQRAVFKEAMDALEEMQKAGKVQVRSMTYFANYMLRFLATDFSFRDVDGKIEIHLENPTSLQGIPVALPRDKYSFVDDGDIFVVREDDYEYVVIGEDVNEKTLVARRR